MTSRTEPGGRGALRTVAEHALVIGLLVLFLSPLIWLMLTAFKPYEELFVSPPTILPTSATLENFSGGWNVGGGRGIGDSLIVSTISTLICLVLGYPAAYALARRFPPHGQLSFSSSTASSTVWWPF